MKLALCVDHFNELENHQKLIHDEIKPSRFLTRYPKNSIVVYDKPSMDLGINRKLNSMWLTLTRSPHQIPKWSWLFLKHTGIPITFYTIRELAFFIKDTLWPDIKMAMDYIITSTQNYMFPFIKSTSILVGYNGYSAFENTYHYFKKN
jgi:hypothetical protein